MFRSTLVVVNCLVVCLAARAQTAEAIKAFGEETYHAYRTGDAMTSFSAAFPEATLADGYAAQAAFVKAMLAHDTIGGYKAAVAGADGQHALGVDGPLTGVVPASGISEVADGVIIDLARDRAQMVETEIGYGFKVNVEEPLPNVAALAQVVAWVAPMLEIPGGAVEETDQPATAADLAARNVNAKGLIIGARHDPKDIDPDDVPITLTHAGAVINEARGDMAAGGQWMTLLKTVNQLVAQGYTITPKHVITNGALGRILPLKIGAYEADYGPLGKVTFETVDTTHADTPRPNIVFIMADDLGYGHLGAYGQGAIHTPHLDALAKAGTRFTDAYAGAPLCAPSRSVLMTGRHTGRTPVRGNSGGIPLRDGDITLAELLQQAGYRTGLFGKWGLGEAGTPGVPNQQGYDEFFGYLHQKHAHFYYTDYLWHNAERYPLEGNMGGKRTQYTPDVILEKALDFIQEADDQPFFCFLSSAIPHHEWTVPKKNLKPYEGKFEEEPHPYRWREGYALPEAPRANMAGMVSHLDDQIGQIMALLEEKGLTDDTLVIFTSDNGPDRYSLACADFFNARGGLRGYKYDLYEGGIRVPAIAHWPGVVPADHTSPFPWHFADILPTFATLSGVPERIPTPVEGRAVVDGLLGKTDIRRFPFFYWDNGDGRAARWGNWKAVQPVLDQPVELYDLASDRAEKRNLAGEYPDVVAYLTARMDRQHQDPPPQVEPSAPDGQYYR